MPCYYYTPEETAAMTRAELNVATELLCRVVIALRRKGILLELVGGLPEWAAEHDEMDRERVQAEEKSVAEQSERNKNRASGLRKLTNEERRALGIYV